MSQPLLIQAVCSCGQDDCGMPAPQPLGLCDVTKVREIHPPEQVAFARKHGVTIKAVPVVMPEDSGAFNALAWVEAFSSNN